MREGDSYGGHQLISWPCCAQDPDLRALRDRREWLEAVERTKGGVSGKAYASARAESKSPFRLVRLLTFGGLGAGAGIGLLIILGRLLSAVKGELTAEHCLPAPCSARILQASWMLVLERRCLNAGTAVSLAHHCERCSSVMCQHSAVRCVS